MSKMKLIKNIEIIEAFQWWQNGDHPIVKQFNFLDIDGVLNSRRCFEEKHFIIRDKTWPG